MKKWLILSLLAMISLANFAQYDPARVNKKAVKIYEEAVGLLMDEKLTEALPLLQKAVELDKNYADAWLSLAGVYGELKKYQLAVDNYYKARDIDSVYFREYQLPCSINLAGLGRFADALTAINAFLANPRLNERSRKSGMFRKKTYEFAVYYPLKHPNNNYVFAPRNLGDSINTVELEYFPSLTLDAGTLVFTRRLGGRNEDFFQSNASGKGWSTALPLKGNINTPLNEGAQHISQDGQWLIFTGCDFPNGAGSCDLFISYPTRQGWTAPLNLGRNINTEFWESQPCLSPDKRELYFTSRRPDSYGGSDIYVSRLQANGSWGPAQNMGPGINSIGDESSPFIHADNQTLYFMSNGHQGYGGDDLFLVRRMADGSWTAPENLGYPINTIENENNLVITADGKTAYYASDRSDTRGGLDIYTFELRTDLRPIQTLWVRGKVYDAKTKNGLPSAVELTDLNSRIIISKVQTDESGNYLITLPVGKDYAFNVNRKGYLLFSDNFLLSKSHPDSTYKKDIPLQPIEVNASVILKNVFFDTKKFDLKPESLVELDQVVQLLKDNPGVKIRINGHTDNVGKAKDNLLLSDTRAKVVMRYIWSKGIDPARLTFKGFGATLPIGDNKTEAGRAMNRRTEMLVTGK